MTGILSNSLLYIFYEYTEGDNIIYESRRYDVPLSYNMSWPAANDAASDVTQRLLKVLAGQATSYWAALSE